MILNINCNRKKLKNLKHNSQVKNYKSLKNKKVRSISLVIIIQNKMRKSISGANGSRFCTRKVGVGESLSKEK